MYDYLYWYWAQSCWEYFSLFWGMSSSLLITPSNSGFPGFSCTPLYFCVYLVLRDFFYHLYVPVSTTIVKVNRWKDSSCCCYSHTCLPTLVSNSHRLNSITPINSHYKCRYPLKNEYVIHRIIF